MDAACRTWRWRSEHPPPPQALPSWPIPGGLPGLWLVHEEGPSSGETCEADKRWHPRTTISPLTTHWSHQKTNPLQVILNGALANAMSASLSLFPFPKTDPQEAPPRAQHITLSLISEKNAEPTSNMLIFRQDGSPRERQGLRAKRKEMSAQSKAVSFHSRRHTEHAREANLQALGLN